MRKVEKSRVPDKTTVGEESRVDKAIVETFESHTTTVWNSVSFGIIFEITLTMSI